MTPRPRTPQQRDRRFARVRRITQTVLIGSGVGSGLFVGYAASIAKPLATIPPTTVSSGASTVLVEKHTPETMLETTES